MAPTTTVRVYPHTRDAITRLSEDRGMSAADLLSELIDRREQDEMLDKMNAAYANQKADDLSWKKEQVERETWSATLADGIDSL